MTAKFKNTDEYIKLFPDETQVLLAKVRKVIKDTIPDAVEGLGYGVPSFKLGKDSIYFAAFKNHIGLYPGAECIEVFKDKLKEYKTSKGTIQFPFDQEVPYDLIREIVKYRFKIK
jgi:uncharacterized protein YdhG (YjbR/CyaY superfamily)